MCGVQGRMPLPTPPPAAVLPSPSPSRCGGVVARRQCPSGGAHAAAAAPAAAATTDVAMAGAACILPRAEQSVPVGVDEVPLEGGGGIHPHDVDYTSECSGGGGSRHGTGRSSGDGDLCGCGDRGDFPSAGRRSSPASREASGMSEAELLHDSSTIRDDSQLTNDTEPRLRPLLHLGAGHEGHTYKSADADEDVTAPPTDGVPFDADPSHAGFRPNAILVVPLEGEGSSEDVEAADEDDVGCDVVTFFPGNPVSSSSSIDAQVTSRPSPAPLATQAEIAAANPSPPPSAGVASLSTASALSTPLSDGAEDMHGWGASVAPSAPAAGATGGVSIGGTGSHRRSESGERHAPTSVDRLSTSPVYQSVSAWLASQYFGMASAGDGRRRVMVFMASSVAYQLAAQEHGGSSAASPTPFPRELTETDRASLCVTLVAHDLGLSLEEDVRIILSAGANGLMGPLVRLSRLPPVPLGPTDVRRHQLPARRPVPIVMTPVPRTAEPTKTKAAANCPNSLPVPPLRHAPARCSARASRHPLRLPRQHTMPSRSPPARGLGPYRGSLQGIVASSRRKARHAAEKAAFPIRGPTAAPRVPRDGIEAEPSALPVSTASRIGDRTNGVQEFELWYRSELQVVNADGNDVYQVVKIRVRVNASVEESDELDGALVCSLQVANVDLSVDGQLAALGRDGPGRVLGYYLERLSLLLAAVPPPDTSVVVKDVGGPGGPNDAAEGISRVTHGQVESRERTLGATLGIGGDAGPIPAFELQAQHIRNRSDEVTAEVSQPAWKWTSSIRRRERTQDGSDQLGFEVRNAPDPTYVEWTWSLVCWSTGLPYNVAAIFDKDRAVWPPLPIELAVPAMMPCVAGLTSRMVIHDQSNAPWSPQWSSDGWEWGAGGGRASPPAPAEAALIAQMDPAEPPSLDPAAPLMSLLSGGMTIAPSSIPLAPSPPPRRSPSRVAAVFPRLRRRTKKVTFVVELAPSLCVHRQTFHRRWWLEDVESKRWPPLPEMGVQRFRFRVRVRQRE